MRISKNDYAIFYEEYYGTLVKQRPDYRFGQAFWNKFLTHETQKEGRLFYCNDKHIAEGIIWKNYIDIGG